MSKLILYFLTFFSLDSIALVEGKLEGILEEKSSQNLDISLLDREISLLYQKGPVLMYDCPSNHWVCTGELEMKRCFKEKKEALLEKDRVFPCAVIHKFKSEKECYAKQQEFINRNISHDFCLNSSP